MARTPPAAPESHLADDAPLAYGVAGFLLLVPAASVLVAAVGFAAGRPIGASHLAMAVGLAAGASLALGALDGVPVRRTLAALALGAAALGAAAMLAAGCWDFSYDGQAYHQSAVSLLARGWNPLAGPLASEVTVHRLWIEHYLRGPELAAAVAYAATGSLEAGKAPGFTLLVAAALLAGTALRRAGAAPAVAAVGAALAAANPVALTQLLTFYVDGQLALLFTCAVALASLALMTPPAAGDELPPCVRLRRSADTARSDRGESASLPRRRPPRSAWPLLAAALALLAQVKFTGVVYAGLLFVAIAAAALGLPRAAGARWRVLALAAAVAAATLAVSWQPLVTNAREHRHPFFPLAGPGARDVVSGQAPRFSAGGRLARFFEATFAESSAGREAPVSKWPFVVRARELEAMAEADVRVGGFGPLFALALVLCAAGAAWYLATGGGRRSSGLLVAAAVIATAAVNPAAWWARYVPQLWLAALVAALSLAAAARPAARWLGAAALVVLAADATLVAGSVARAQVRTQAAAAAQLRELARAGPEIEIERGEMESLQPRFAAAGLRATYRAPCARAVPVIGAAAARICR
jgi:hypothetical protein